MAQHAETVYAIEPEITPELTEVCTRFPNIQVVHGFSPAMAQPFSDQFFDMVYIDADHAYKAVVADIVTWLPKIKTGGLLAGHDYHHRFGVVKAIRDIFNTEPDILFQDTSWAFWVTRGVPPEPRLSPPKTP